MKKKKERVVQIDRYTDYNIQISKRPKGKEKRKDADISRFSLEWICSFEKNSHFFTHRFIFHCAFFLLCYYFFLHKIHVIFSPSKSRSRFGKRINIVKLVFSPPASGAEGYFVFPQLRVARKPCRPLGWLAANVSFFFGLFPLLARLSL